ncbi:unnamed protein product, partial [Linum tenue]
QQSLRPSRQPTSPLLPFCLYSVTYLQALCYAFSVGFGSFVTALSCYIYVHFSHNGN